MAPIACSERKKNEMSGNKKSAKSTRKTVKPDVQKPGRSAPSVTSKPIIVTNRPILKDPMMVSGASRAEEADKKNLAHVSEPRLEPIDEKPAETETPKSAKPEVVAPDKEPREADPTAKAEPESPVEKTVPENQKADSGIDAKPDKKDDKGVGEQAQAVRDAAVQELIESRRYELPINAVEKRKAKHFVILGILLAVILALVWADIALDAGLIRIDGVKPVTHFFSN